jgi:DNA-directed RNA polymerase subunit RPC12/RpoP
MKNYQCSKCATLVQEDHQPSYAPCPKGSSHSWIDMGNVGSENWQCSKCFIQLKSDHQPSYAPCPKGSSHGWTKL